MKYIILAALSVLATSYAYAYSYSDNRGLFPMGEQEELMANTGVALSGSTGAVAYNPAGLASLQKNHISLSANSYLQTRTKFDSLQTVEGSDQSFTTSGIQSIPTAFVSTWHTTSMVWAFSVLVPHELKVQDSVSYSTPSYSSMVYSRMQSFELLMVGFSGARKIDEFDAGAGCFYTMYHMTAQGSFDGQPSAGGGIATPLVVDTFEHAEANGLFCNAGIQRQQSEKLRWGASLRLPFIAFNKSATSSEFAQIQGTGSGAIEPHPVDADYQIPADLGFGIEYQHTPEWRSYADLNYQVGTTISGPAPTTYKATPRLNFGADYKYTPKIHFMGGLAYNPGAATVDDNNYSENYIIATFGARMLDGNSSLGVGLLMAQSSGTMSSQIYNATFASQGTKSSGVSTQATGIMINSGYVF